MTSGNGQKFIQLAQKHGTFLVITKYKDKKTLK